ncbi:thioredoxin-like protein [Xylariaceae sp. FL0594]|nr:thioredoxin-like protein [Xylariaceae sp. FL0594]
MTNFTIDVISDPVCIWCYIGKKRLDRAIALYKRTYPGGRDDTFTVNWKAFYLDATAPVPGIPIVDRLRQKVASSSSSSSSFSSPDGNGDVKDIDAIVAKLRDRLVSMGRQEGISVSLRGRIGNTRSAHRAILFAKRYDHPLTDTPHSTMPEPKVQNAYVSALFAAYFEGAIDVTSLWDLADVAEKVGIDRAEMLAYLESEGGAQEVDDEDREARTKKGLRGVPNFTVQGREVLDGAQDVESFLELFVKIKEAEREGGEVEAEEMGSRAVSLLSNNNKC